MRGDLVWEDRALKSNFPGFLSEPGDESPGKKGINKMAEQRRGFNQTWLLFLLWLYSKKKKKKKKFIRLCQIWLQESNDYDRLKSMDWSTDSFIDLFDWLNIQMGSHDLSILCLYGQRAEPCLSDWRGGGLRAGSGERPCFEAAGVQSKGRWRERGRGGSGFRSRGWGHSVRTEESWEMQWQFNYGHHWVYEQHSNPPTHFNHWNLIKRVSFVRRKLPD